MKDPAKDQHGGARPGAGRPALGKARGVRCWVTLAPDVLAVVDAIAREKWPRKKSRRADALRDLVQAGVAGIDLKKVAKKI